MGGVNQPLGVPSLPFSSPFPFPPPSLPLSPSFPLKPGGCCAKVGCINPSWGGCGKLPDCQTHAHFNRMWQPRITWVRTNTATHQNIAKSTKYRSKIKVTRS